MRRVSLTVNGAEITAEVEPRTQLADFLREHFFLTGTHIGCEHGVCGACTILLNGAPARSCIAFAAALEGEDVRTIEGLEDDPVIVALRAAFTAEHALQCGYCTPGMLVTARDIVLRLPQADEATIRHELAGNLCRCTGYAGIVRAIRRVLAEAPAHPPAAPARPVATARPVPAPLAVSAPALHTPPPPAVPADAGSSFALAVPVARPRAEVWAALHDPALIAGCVPGARLTMVGKEGITDERIAGEMRVALGPITAAFAGAARVRFDEPAHTAVLAGEARDARTGTRLSGEATIALAAASDATTTANLSVTYALAGPLAQLARGAIVRAVAGQIAQTVGRNLERLLAGAPVSPPPPRLSAFSLLARTLWRQLRRLLGRR
jgi:aerobic carbon-monoxide dehydrogenase small subunit